MPSLVRHLARGIGRVATDAMVRGARPFPRRIADLDAEALSRLMGRPVRSPTVLDGSAGTTTRARLRLDGDGIPGSVFVKMPATSLGGRLIGELGQLAETEVRFYRELSTELTGVPRVHGSAFDPPTGRFVLILEDLAGTSCEFPDTTCPLGADRAAGVVELLARLHGTLRARIPAWLHTGSADPSLALVPVMLRISARRVARNAGLAVDAGRFITENYPAVARIIDAAPHTVLHGDPHPGNTYFRDGRAGLLDWQAVRRGHPARDLAYLLVTGMTTDDRRSHQRELLDTYRGALAAAGGPHLDGGELWLRYRQAAAYAYVAALVTAGLGGMQTEDIALAGLRLAIAALGDLETVAALQEST